MLIIHSICSARGLLAWSPARSHTSGLDAKRHIQLVPRCRARLARLTSLPTRASESRLERTEQVRHYTQASSSRHPIHGWLKLVFESLLQFYATPSLFLQLPQGPCNISYGWPHTVGSNGGAEEVPSPPGQGSNSTVKRIAVSVCCCCSLCVLSSSASS
ncbi:hypothetical protein B0J15DRAFT_129289 [Fusarium solani]|uniref:Uncharacterized protein n=1 Tax=Fusarium solani TaxID=169388 RepID=A0A9P9L554_FUSSL|nr:uncharacterized protein B0J15DRAFT_129289 [Fusarium solani]KAH7274424.1 hypothetical protein B0J15DRAFT_129289 [Fusarium solani]